MAVACALLAVATAGHAEPDKSIDVQLFDYSLGPKTFFTVDNGDVAAPKTLALDFLVTYLTNPFTVYQSTGPNNTSVRERKISRASNSSATAWNVSAGDSARARASMRPAPERSARRCGASSATALARL